MDIFERYKSDPYFELNFGLSNGQTIIVKWNVFKDKKDGNRPVMRPRYVLVDLDGNRLSLKTLNLITPVEFKQIELSEMSQDLIDTAKTHNYREMFISTHFGEWINNTMIPMFNSGENKVIKIEDTHGKRN